MNNLLERELDVIIFVIAVENWRFCLMYDTNFMFMV